MKRAWPTLGSLLLASVARAHHTKDHLLPDGDLERVATAAREGAGGPWTWLAWGPVLAVLLVGFVRWWRRKV